MTRIFLVALTIWATIMTTGIILVLAQNNEQIRYKELEIIEKCVEVTNGSR